MIKIYGLMKSSKSILAPKRAKDVLLQVEPSELSKHVKSNKPLTSSDSMLVRNAAENLLTYIRDNIKDD